MMEIKTTDAFICRAHIYHALYLPGYIKRLEKALTNHEYGNGYVYKDAVGLFFAVDILPHLEKESIWAYLEVIPEEWVVRDLRIEPASEPGHEIHCGRVVRSFGTHITWSGYEHLPKQPSITFIGKPLHW